MSLLEMDRIAESVSDELERHIIEFVQCPDGTWYINLTSLKGKYATGGSFHNRWPERKEKAIEVAANFMNEALT